MAKNEVYRVGQYIPAPVPAATAAGVARRQGSLNFVTVTPEGKDGNYALQASADTDGAHLLAVAVTVAPLVFGDPVYITAGNVLQNAATAGNEQFGIYIEPDPTPVGAAPLCVVKIVQVL